MNFEDDPQVRLFADFEDFDSKYQSWNVARAHIRSDDGTAQLHILVTLFHLDKKAGREDAILRRSTELRDELLAEHRERARSLDHDEWMRIPCPRA
jgi:hypothetical protein